MKVLFVSWWFPYPPNNGSRIRIFNLLKQMSLRHAITLLTFSEDPVHDQSQTAALAPYCTDVQVFQKIPFRPGRWSGLEGLLSTFPYSFVATYNPDMQTTVNQLSTEHDLLLASQIWTSQYFLRSDNQVKKMPKVLEELETTPFFEGRNLEKGWLWRIRYQPMWWKFKRLVQRIASDFDGITVASDQELNLLKQIAGSHCPAKVVPNGVDLDYHQTDAMPRPKKLIFPGALTFFANYEAMEWFLGEIYPLVQAKVPDVQLDITGSTKGIDLDALPQRRGVTFTGYVPDIRPVVAGSWACIVPLQVGGGTRLKILEALALGTPVVSTSKGAEGLDLQPEHDILIADDPATFARQTVRLLRNPTLRHHLAENGRKAVQRYDWTFIGERLDHFLERIEAAA